MNITLWKAINGQGVSVNLNGFEPKEGYANFLKDLCAHWGGLVDWHQGFESGNGNIPITVKKSLFVGRIPLSL